MVGSNKRGAGVRAALLAAILIISALPAACQISYRAAVDDVSVSVGAVRNGEVLSCSVDPINRTVAISLVRFNTTGVSVMGDDIAILALRAVLINTQGQIPSMMAAYPISSNWSEGSNISTIDQVLEPVRASLANGTLQGNETIRMDNDDWIFSFDVSKILRSQRAENVSFAIAPLNDEGYAVDFRSRETGEGPVLMVIPLPRMEAVVPAAAKIPDNTTISGDAGLRFYIQGADDRRRCPE